MIRSERRRPQRRSHLRASFFFCASTFVTAAGCGKSEASTATEADGGTTRVEPTLDAGIDAPELEDASSGSDAALQGTRYERVGKRDGIAAAVKDIVEGPNGLISNPSLAAYFQIRTGSDAGGAPSTAAVMDCLTELLGELAGGPEKYAGHVAPGGHVCRPMGPAHAGLSVSQNAFIHFLSITATRLTSRGVPDADVQTLVLALAAALDTIVDGTRAESAPVAPRCAAFTGGNANDAGSDAGGNCVAD